MNTQVESVTVYHSGALVKRSSNTSLQPGLNELIFKGLSSKIVLNSLKVKNKQITILNKSIIRKLSNEEFSQLIDQKDALTKQMDLIEAKYNEVGFISKVEDLEVMTAFYAEQMIRLKKDLRDVERRITEAEKIEDIKLNNNDAAILKLVVSSEEGIKGDFEFQYVCGGIGWSPAYDIRVESSSDKRIQVKYLARVMSQTGEDWEDVSINLSSSFPLESPTELPKSNSPWVIQGRSFSFSNPFLYEDATPAAKQEQIALLEGVEYQQIRIPTFLKIRSLEGKYSLKSNSTIFTFPIQSIDLPARYYYYGYPSLDPEVYLVAEIIDWSELGLVDGIANISFKGNDVGNTIVRFSEFSDTLLLPIGKDNSVFMQRKEIADKRYFKETKIGKKKKTTLAYKLELKNNNQFAIQFEMLDQIPISQTKSAKVDLDQISNAELNKENGELKWLLELEPGQSAQKELIFTLEIDAEYSYSRKSSDVSFKAINCPSF